jgi:hypothetical protein
MNQVGKIPLLLVKVSSCDEVVLMVKLVPDEVKIAMFIISTACILGRVVGLGARSLELGIATASALFTLLASIYPLQEAIKQWSG